MRVPILRSRFPDTRPDYRTHREPTTTVTPRSRVIEYSHWDGSQDAVVAPKPAGMTWSFHTAAEINDWSPTQREEIKLWLPPRLRRALRRK